MKLLLKLTNDNYVTDAIYLATEDYSDILSNDPSYQEVTVLKNEPVYPGITKLIETEGVYTLETDVDKLAALQDVEQTKSSYEEEIVQNKQYLTDTDYIITKISEAKLSSESAAEELQAKYSEIISKREAARTEINELEEKLAAL